MTMGIYALRSIKCGEVFLEADAFKAAFLAASHTGCQDFAAYARSELERVSVGESSARHILRHYIRSSRRERSPLPPFLADSLE
jgi:hypothetical protein